MAVDGGFRATSSARSARALALTIVLCGAAAATSAQTSSIYIKGQDGLDGPPGTPTQAGGNGQDGGDASAFSFGAGPHNRVTARAGDGGDGGDAGASDLGAGDGGDGGDGIVTPGPNPPVGSVEANAGGGNGGNGGRPLADGHLGGSGGDGGDAFTASSGRSQRFTDAIVANAAGGNGGDGFGANEVGGDGGHATGSISPANDGYATTRFTLRGGDGGAGSEGADGGDGGSADLAEELVVPLPAASGTATRRANGGAGGESDRGQAGEGGDAIVESVVVTDANGLADLHLGGGRGGVTSDGGRAGDGGNARGTARVDAGGSAYARVSSFGGSGGDIDGGSGDGGRAGETTAIAEARSTSASERVTAIATATGTYGGDARGVGRRAADGGQANGRASADGGSSARVGAELVLRGGSGGHGRAGASGGDGASIEARQGVAATGRRVSMRQSVEGGDGGYAEAFEASSGMAPRAGRGGDALSERFAVEGDAASETASVSLEAEGGRGGVTRRGGDARVAGSVVAQLDASIGAQAVGGTGGHASAASTRGGDGGVAETGPLFARATDADRGEASAGVSVHGGDGGDGVLASGRGADAIVIDRVDAQAANQIELGQTAWSGNAGVTEQGHLAGSGASGGRAVNVLRRTVDTNLVAADLSSRGGASTGRDDKGRARAGGDAVAELDLTNVSGGNDAEFGAEGGAGANLVGADSGRGGRGGEARVDVVARSGGDSGRLRLDPASRSNGATGGDGGNVLVTEGSVGKARQIGGDGGAAYSRVVGDAEGEGWHRVESEANGGNGGHAETTGRGGNGGDAIAEARGHTEGSGNLYVSAQATGGHAGRGRDLRHNGRAGRARVRAHASSSGGADAEARATLVGGSGGRDGGADALLFGATSGETTGRLRLSQSAYGGGSSEGKGGDARSVLVELDLDGGDLALLALAEGGAGGSRGGDAFAAVVGIGREAVDVTAWVEAGSAESWVAGKTLAGKTGRARLGPVFGASLGGEAVSVSARMTGARGGGRASAAHVRLDNAVDGWTTGDLTFSQTAIAGLDWQDDGARGGNAFNRLARDVASESLTVTLRTTAHAGLVAGHATGHTDLVNRAGSISITNDAEAGEGAYATPAGQGSPGGDAFGSNRARTHGDGHFIRIESELQGGRVRDTHGSLEDDGTTTSGDATLISRAIAHGDSEVWIRDRAAGGYGPVGGSGSARAFGSNQGASRVQVRTEAFGGGANLRAGGAPGTAFSESVARTPLGEATAHAKSTALGLAAARPDGWARARSTADGHSAVASSTAIGATGTSIDDYRNVTAIAWARGEAALSTSATTGLIDLPAPGSTRSNAAVAVNGFHDQAREFGRASIRLASSSSGPESGPDIVLGSSILWRGDFREEAGPALAVSFLDFRALDAAGGTLGFSILADQTPILEREFSDAESAAVFFRGSIDLRALLDERASRYRSPDLQIQLESIGAHAGARYELDFALVRSALVAVPEPSTATLCLVGLILLRAAEPSSRRRYTTAAIGGERPVPRREPH